MSDEEFESENGSQDSEGIKSLRKQYEAAQKELRELREAQAKRDAAERAEQVKVLLKAKGVPESAAKFYSGEDASADAVGKWIEENADIFKPTVQAAPDPNAEAAARVAAASYGDHGGVQVESGVKPRVLGSPQEIQNLLDTQPYAELVKLGLMPKNDPYRRPQV